MDRNTGGRGPSHGRNDILAKLLDYVCDNFFQEVPFVWVLIQFSFYSIFISIDNLN